VNPLANDFVLCPICGLAADEDSAYLGTLARIRWYRCPGCGIDYHLPPVPTRLKPAPTEVANE
jgi:hypothetical protein